MTRLPKIVKKYAITEGINNLPEIGTLLNDARELEGDLEFIQRQLNAALNRRDIIIKQVKELWTEEEIKSSGFNYS
jgi:hypothetical protein